MPASPAAEKLRTAIRRVYVPTEGGHAGKLVVEWSPDEPFQELTLALGAPHILRILCMRHLRVLLRDSAALPCSLSAQATDRRSRARGRT